MIFEYTGRWIWLRLELFPMVLTVEQIRRGASRKDYVLRRQLLRQVRHHLRAPS